MTTGKKPNILVILTDQQRNSTVYESVELRRFRREVLTAEESLRESGITFECHYTMSTACTPSRASFLTGQYPSLHGVTQTDGLAKSAESKDMFWLAPDTVPTAGDWFRAGGYRTFYKGKWHVSHAFLDAPDGKGPLQSLKDDGTPIAEGIASYLDADLLNKYGFSEWVGPEPHGRGRHNTGTAKDHLTADETIALLQRLDRDGSEQPWLAVCSFLNPHDIAIFGILALAQGLRYNFRGVPRIPKPPTLDEDLSTKPTCHQSYIDVWGKMLAPQPQIQAQRRFYYQLQRTVDQEMARVLDSLRATKAYENTIVIFTADHGEMLGAHGGMHQKWHNAYEEAIHVPFLVSSPLFKGGPRCVNIPTSHADLLPTMLGLAGIDQDKTLRRVAANHSEARPLVGRDLSGVVLGTQEPPLSEPVLFITDDEISEGSEKPSTPFQVYARWAKTYEIVAQPNHIETVVADVDVNGEKHRVKFSRYHDNQQFWTVPGKRDERLNRRKVITVTEPAPDEYELYDLTLDPLEQRNLAHPSHADERTRQLQKTMLGLLVEQLKAKRLIPASGGLPGYWLPVTA
jgi:arylsulfatase A-like enzyme